MKSKWSKVIKSESPRIAVESFEMTELIPYVSGQGGPRLQTQEEESEVEPPHDCSALQQQAFEAGRDGGIEEGRAQCQAEVQQELQRALSLVGQVDEAKTTMLQQVDTDLVELALAIARKVIQREATINKDIVTEHIQHILKNLSAVGSVCLKVHPDEVTHLQNVQSNLVTREGDQPSIRIESDPSVGIGGCIIQTDGLHIDAAVEQQLELIGEALGQRGESHGSFLPSATS